MKRYGMFFLAVMISSPAFAAQAEALGPVRACTEKDLLGSWDVVSMPIRTTVDGRDPYFYPFQRMTFTPNGKLQHVASDRPLNSKNAVTVYPSEPSFRLDENGILAVNAVGLTHGDVATCSFVLEDVPSKMLQDLKDPRRVPKKGDILLSYHDPEGKLLFGRALRKANSR